MAHLLRLTCYIRNTLHQNDNLRPIVVQELKRAEIVILKLLQEKAFGEEIKTIQKRNKQQSIGSSQRVNVKRTSKLWRLDPIY